QPLCSVFAVFRGNVAAHARLRRSFMLSAFQNYLNAIAFFCHDCSISYYSTRCPFALASFRTAEIPCLLMLFIALVDNFSVIHLSSSGMKKRFFCRFG